MSTRRALAFSFLDRYAGLALAIGSSMVIARLLTPAEIGAFSVTMLLLSFISGLRDMGAGQYLLQSKVLDDQRIRATWTVLLGVGFFFAVVVLAAAHPVAAFYREPGMVLLLQVLALNFAVSPFGSLTYAWLMREMKFQVLATMRLASSLTTAVVSVGLAWKGYGALSLAIGSLAGTLVNALVATAFRPRGWPWWPSTRGVGQVLSFGSKVGATTLMNNVAGSIPELLLGRFTGLHAAGLFSRANGLVTLFNKLVMDAANSVAMPLFAQESRARGSTATAVLRATCYVTGIGWTFFLFIGLFTGPVIRLLYGPQWDDSVGLARTMALGMAVGLPGVFVSTALTSTGQVGVLSRLTLLLVSQYIATMAVGAWLGMAYIGWAFVLASSINAVLWVWCAQRALQVPVGLLLRDSARSLAVALMTTAVAAAAAWLAGMAGAAEPLLLMIAAAGGLLGFPLACVSLDHPLAEEIERLRQMVRLRRSST